jgi:hypothetical protein
VLEGDVCHVVARVIARVMQAISTVGAFAFVVTVPKALSPPSPDQCQVYLPSLDGGVAIVMSLGLTEKSFSASPFMMAVLCVESPVVMLPPCVSILPVWCGVVNIDEKCFSQHV